jgi:hypothetical protein
MRFPFFYFNSIEVDMEYATSDIYEAASEVTCGFEIIRIDPGQRGRMEFIFKQTEDLDRCVNDFFNGRLVLNVKSFISSWRQLRRRIDQEEMRNERPHYKNHRR